MDATARIANIHRSFNAFVKTHLATGQSLNVKYGYEKGADRDVSGLSEWISILWITEDLSTQSSIDLQINCVVRDEGGLPLDLLVDKVTSVLTAQTRIPFYDYSDVGSPVLIGGMILEPAAAARDLPDKLDGLRERVLEYELFVGRKLG